MKIKKILLLVAISCLFVACLCRSVKQPPKKSGLWKKWNKKKQVEKMIRRRYEFSSLRKEIEIP